MGKFLVGVSIVASALALAGAAATAPVSAPELAAIVKGLGSEDFAARTAAQKRLDQVPVSQRGELEKLAREAGDPEVKARLASRLDGMEEELILNLPPVSLELEKGTLAEAAAKLAQASGIALTGGVNAREAGGLVSASVKERSFFEVIQQLSSQQSLHYGPSPTGVQIAAFSDPAGAKLSVCGPLLFVTQKPVVPPSGVNNLGIAMTVFADPRLQVVGRNYVFSEGRDDQGGKLDVVAFGVTGFGGSGPVGPVDYARVNHAPWSVRVAKPVNGRMLVSLKGEARLQVVVHYEVQRIDEPEKHLGETFKVGGREVIIKQFGPAERAFPVQLEVKQVVGAEQVDVMAMEGSAAISPVRIYMEDSTGREFANLSSGIPRSVPLAAMDGAKGPLHLVVAAPVKWKTLTVPIELKDLQLP